MSIRIDGTNTTANPGITGGDADTGLQFGTDEISIVTGGTEQAKVDSSGRLLVGTTTPVNGSVFGNAETRTAQFYTTVDSGNQGLGVYNVSANPFAARLELGTGKPSFAALGTNNYLGVISFVGSDGSKFVSGAMISAETDATVSANDLPTRLVFSTTADGASSPTERMRIDRNGKWYLDNVDLFDPTYIGQIRVNGTGGLLFRNGSTSGRYPLAFQNSAGTFVGSINAGNGSTAYNTSSDYRLKENVVAITDGISRLKQLQPKRFNFIIEAEKTVDGFIAHEVQDIIPEAIHGEKDAVDDEGNPVYQGIDQSKLVPLLTAALQEAIVKIETLETKVAALEANP